MRQLTIILLALLCFTNLALAQQVTPSDKVNAAFTAEELASMSADEITILNITAEHLCWFEDVKPENTSPVYQLHDKNGTPVVLSESDLSTFNPYMYTLPQGELVCENLIIVTTEGTKHLLVIRSEAMMNKKIEQEKTKLAKKKLSK